MQILSTYDWEGARLLRSPQHQPVHLNEVSEQRQIPVHVLYVPWYQKTDEENIQQQQCPTKNLQIIANLLKTKVATWLSLPGAWLVLLMFMWWKTTTRVPAVIQECQAPIWTEGLWFGSLNGQWGGVWASIQTFIIFRAHMHWMSLFILLFTRLLPLQIQQQGVSPFPSSVSTEQRCACVLTLRKPFWDRYQSRQHLAGPRPWRITQKLLSVVTVDYGNQFKNTYEFKALEKRAVKKKMHGGRYQMHCITYIIVAFLHNDFQDDILKDQNLEALRRVLDAESHQNPLFFHSEYIIASYFLMLKMDRFSDKN